MVFVSIPVSHEDTSAPCNSKHTAGAHARRTSGTCRGKAFGEPHIDVNLSGYIVAREIAEERWQVRVHDCQIKRYLHAGEF
jgi:hypothetical protein